MLTRYACKINVVKNFNQKHKHVTYSSKRKNHNVHVRMVARTLSYLISLFNTIGLR